MIFQWSIVALVIVADQLTKYLVETKMHLWQSITVVKGFLNLTYVRNTGIGFSFFANSGRTTDNIVFVVIFSIITGLIIFSFMWKERNWLFNLSMGLLIGGAISNNVISRLFFGFVIDFIQLPYWPVFNVADSCVVAGAVGIGLYFLKRDGKNAKRHEDRVESHDERSG